MSHPMPSDNELLLVALDDLRPGMFVQLDLGWMDHPFRRNRFQIESAEQIATLRGLGLKQVRVRRDLSAPDSFLDAIAESQADDLAPIGPTSGSALVPPPVLAPASDPADAVTDGTADRACEQAHARALQAWSTMARDVVRDPAAGRQGAQSLAQSLIGELLKDEHTTLRLVGEASGSAASLHAIHVSVLSLMLARRLSVPEASLPSLALGALLHDVGKLAQSHATGAPAPSSHDHVIQGVRLGMAMGLEAASLRVIAQHHEHADGSGGPKNLKAEAIDLSARIVGVVDRYDRLCNPLDGSPSRTPHEAQALLYAKLRNCHDALVLTGFVKMLGVYPPGSVVELSDGALALVEQAHPTQPLRPILRVYRAAQRRERCERVELSAAADLSIRRSLHPHHLPRTVLDALSPPVRASYFFAPSPTVVPPAAPDRIAA